jgi:hypothetical protein
MIGLVALFLTAHQFRSLLRASDLPFQRPFNICRLGVDTLSRHLIPRLKITIPTKKLHDVEVSP